jgi:hypothetical protein
MFIKQIRCAFAGVAMLAAFATTPAQAVTLTLDVPCDSFTLSGNTLTCVTTQPTQNTPTGCSAKINGGTSAVQLPNTGGTVNLDVQGCSTTGSGPITYQWLKNGASFSQNQSPTDTLGSNSNSTAKTWSYQVKACNNGVDCTSPMPASPLTAVVAAASGGGGGGGGGAGIDCSSAGFASTIVMNFNYVPGAGQVVKTSNGMSTSDILVATFTTPATIAGGTGSGASIVITDNAANSGGFVASLSTTPCTFTSNLKGGLLSASWSNLGNIPLQPNTQYFVNIKGDSALSVKLLAK